MIFFGYVVVLEVYWMFIGLLLFSFVVVCCSVGRLGLVFVSVF